MALSLEELGHDLDSALHVKHKLRRIRNVDELDDVGIRVLFEITTEVAVEVCDRETFAEITDG
jgi:hypothetical protein